MYVHSKKRCTFAASKENKQDNTQDVKQHPTNEKKIVYFKERKGNIMKKLVNKLTASKKFNKYCVNMLKMYNYGRVSIPA